VKKDEEKREDEYEAQDAFETGEGEVVEEMPATPEEAEASLEEVSAEPETPAEQLAKVQSEAAEYLDGWQRARAEFANFKKRVDRETEESRQRITAEIILRYINVMDDLERALCNAPQDEKYHEWVSGIELIHQKFEAILESEGVESIETEGERFDPNLHEAISYEESEAFEGGSIIAVTQRGYKLGDRIIRPAMVRVAK